MASFAHAYLRDVRFEAQVYRVRMQLATPSTKSACSEKVRFQWTEPSVKAPRNTLEPEDVVRVHQLAAQGVHAKSIAQRFSVRTRQIERILTGRSWKGLWPGALPLTASAGGDLLKKGDTARPAQFTQGDGRACREARLEGHAASRREA